MHHPPCPCDCLAVSLPSCELWLNHVDMRLVRWARFEEKNTVISTGGDFLRWQTVNVKMNNNKKNKKKKKKNNKKNNVGQQAKTFCHRMANYMAKTGTFSGSKGWQIVKSSSNIEGKPGCLIQQMHMDVESGMSFGEFCKTWQLRGISRGALTLLWNLLQPLVPP